jgi:hypothetical protein
MTDLLNLSSILNMQSNFVLGISLPRQIIRQIDSERGDVPRSRYVLRILEKQYALKGIEVKEGSLDRRLGTLQPSETLSQ